MIERILHKLSTLLAVLGSVALILMMLQMVADVAMRYLFNSPIQGNLQVVSEYNMVGVVFLPLAMVEWRHEHITVDLLIQLFPATLRTIVYVLGYLIASIFFGLLAYQTLLDAVHSYQIGEIMMGTIQIIIWPAKFLVPIGFATIMLVTILHAWQALTRPDFKPVPSSPDVAVDPS